MRPFINYKEDEVLGIRDLFYKSPVVQVSSSLQKSSKGAMTLSITTLSIMSLSIATFSIMTFSRMTFSIETLSIIGLFATLSIIDTEYKC